MGPTEVAASGEALEAAWRQAEGKRTCRGRASRPRQVQVWMRISFSFFEVWAEWWLSLKGRRRFNAVLLFPVLISLGFKSRTASRI
jgi:hypothetical protein